MTPASQHPNRTRRLLRVRAIRHGLFGLAVVLLVCGATALVSALSYGAARAEVRGLSARAVGELTRTAFGPEGKSVEVRWQLPDGRQTTARVNLAVSPPKAGTRSEIAYDPASPEHAIIPGADVLAQIDRAASGITFSALVVLGVLATTGWRLVSRSRLTRRPVRTAEVRRVRFQSGLITRSWLETEDGPQRWIPVYFDPVLTTLPSPTTVRVHGSPANDRMVAVEADGVILYPSGRVVRTEPRGRRADNPVRPDESLPTPARTDRAARQLRADAALLIPAPLVGLFWAFLDGGGFPVWLAATVITASVALWWAALRGSDPT